MKRLLFTLFVAAALIAVAPAYAKNERNPFGITVVRFSDRTTPAQMRAAVAQAGGSVVTDLSALGALAVSPGSGDFASSVRSNGRVAAVFVEPIFRTPVGSDFTSGGGPASAPVFGTLGTFPDPWHDSLQWDDARMNVPDAWTKTPGDRNVRVAVLDSGVQGSHKELKANFAGSKTFIPCSTLARDYGAAIVKEFGLRDCSDEDKEGHGTWVASRIAGAANGFASNGVAPSVQVSSYKVLAAEFGGLPDWILAGLMSACSDGVDLVNLSIGGYLDPVDFADAQTYLLFVDAVRYCRERGVTVFGSAGNDHVRIDRVSMSVGGRSLTGVGRVSLGGDGIATARPESSSLGSFDRRGLLAAPAGVPGVVMVSATNNANDAAPADDAFGRGMHVGARDQLAYYSSYGSRVDLAAPGGARRFNLPGWDGGDGNVLYGGWGSFGALDASGVICSDPVQSSLFNFACFKVQGSGFGWMQGTSMATPNAVGVAALALSAKPALRHDPGALVGRMQSTARRSLTNYTGPTDPASTAATYDGRACSTGYCHVATSRPIAFADAYGAGLVDAGAAVTP